jgi:hypothetical protein
LARFQVGSFSTIEYREINQVPKLFDLMPLMQILQIIGSDKIKKPHSGIIPEQLPDRLDGEGGSLALKLAVIHGKTFFGSNSLPEHGQS